MTFELCLFGYQVFAVHIGRTQVEEEPEPVEVAKPLGYGFMAADNEED